MPTRATSISPAQQKIATGTLIGGGAVIVTGIVLVVLNRPYTRVPERRPTIKATVGSGAAGVLVSATF